MIIADIGTIIAYTTVYMLSMVKSPPFSRWYGVQLRPRAAGPGPARGSASGLGEFIAVHEDVMRTCNW